MTSMHALTRRLAPWAAAAALTLPSALQAATYTEFYIGVDSRATNPSGTYAGLANPNHNRLTLLYNHGDHFHGMGVYSYTGTPPSQVVVSTSSNNRLPETYTLQPPPALQPGAGIYAGKLVTRASDVDYTNLRWQSIDLLEEFAHSGEPGSDEADILLHSSGNRWSASISGADVLLQLVSISAGLHVGSDSVTDLFDFGVHDIYRLGAGGTLDFPLVLWTAADAAPGTYSAEFRLLDANSLFGPSGTFSFDVSVTPVPLPAAFWFLATGLVALLRYTGRRSA